MLNKEKETRRYGGEREETRSKYIIVYYDDIMATSLTS